MIVSERIHATIRQRLITKAVIKVVEDDIVIDFIPAIGRVVGISGSKLRYQAVNNCVHVPCSPDNLAVIYERQFNVKLQLKKKKILIPFSCIECGDLREYVCAGETLYPLRNDMLVAVDRVWYEREELRFKFSVIGAQESLVDFFLVGDDQCIGGKTDKDMTVAFSNILTAIGNHTYKVVAVIKDEAVHICLRSEIDKKAELAMYQDRNRVLVKRNLSGYAFAKRTIDSRRSIVSSQQKTIGCEFEQNKLVVHDAPTKNIRFFWTNLQDGTGTDAETLMEGEELCIEFNTVLNKARAPFERDVLMFESYTEGEKEAGYVVLNVEEEKKYIYTIVYENEVNQLVRTLTGKLIAEKRGCYLTYPERMKYDFSCCSFSAQISNMTVEDEQIAVDLTVVSLLQPMTSIVLYAFNSQDRTSMFLQEWIAEKPTSKMKETVVFRWERSEEYMNKPVLRIGVRYLTGYTEEHDLCVLGEDIYD